MLLSFPRKFTEHSMKETATLLNDLALMLQEEARFPEAQAFLQRALAIRRLALDQGTH